MNYATLEKKIIKIVKSASKIMKRRSFEITEKDGSINIVTSADIDTQKYLCQRLSRLIPECKFYCEEENMKATEGEYIFVIDPIDGTANYSRGIADCAISVALLHNKQAVVGVVYNPFANELFSAHKGGGARLNGKSIHVSSRSFDSALFCTAMSLYKKELAALCNDIICETYALCNDFRRFGSCALELCYLAAGRCDIYFEIRVFPWDYAGAAVVLSEAGGVLCGYNGKEPCFDGPTPLIAANNPENLDTLNQIVNKYMKNIPYTE